MKTRKVHVLELGTDFVLPVSVPFLRVPFCTEKGFFFKTYDTRFQDREFEYIAIEVSDETSV